MKYILTDDDLERLRWYADQKIRDLRLAASPDEIQPEGIVDRWSRGRCLCELIELEFLGSEFHEDE